MRLALHQRCLRPLRCGDVARHLGGAEQTSGAVPHRRDRERHVDDLAILAPAPRLEMRDRLAAPDALKRLERFLLIFRRHEDGDGFANHFFGRVAENSFRAPVPVRNNSFERRSRDGVFGRRHNRSETAHRLFVGFSIRVAEQDTRRLDQFAIADNSPAHPDPWRRRRFGRPEIEVESIKTRDRLPQSLIDGAPIVCMNRSRNPAKSSRSPERWPSCAADCASSANSPVAGT